MGNRGLCVCAFFVSMFFLRLAVVFELFVCSHFVVKVGFWLSFLWVVGF